MNKIVVYNSDTGFTKKYADWIAAELECSEMSSKEYLKQPKNSDILIYGSGIMASQIKGLNKIKKTGQFKHLITFATGLLPPEAADVVAKIRQSNFTSDEQQEMPFFYFHGGLSYEELGLMSRQALKTIRKMLEKKKDKTPEDMHMAEYLKQSADYTNRDTITPLLNCVKELENTKGL